MSYLVHTLLDEVLRTAAVGDALFLASAWRGDESDRAWAVQCRAKLPLWLRWNDNDNDNDDKDLRIHAASIADAWHHTYSLI